MNVSQIKQNDLDIDLPNAKLAFTIIQSLLKSHEALSDLLVVMAHALDEDVVKALTTSSSSACAIKTSKSLKASWLLRSDWIIV